MKKSICLILIFISTTFTIYAQDSKTTYWDKKEIIETAKYELHDLLEDINK